MNKVMRMFLILNLALALMSSSPLAVRAHEREGHGEEAHDLDSEEALRHFLEEGEKAPGFRLINQDGKAVALADLIGRPCFLAFIYTRCKDACPLILQNRKRLEAQLAPSIGRGIVFLAVSFDPAHDRPEVLKDFIKKIGVETKDLHLLTGEPDAVSKVLRDYKITVFKDRTTGEPIGHSALGYAIDAGGVIREILNFSL